VKGIIDEIKDIGMCDREWELGIPYLGLKESLAILNQVEEIDW